MNKFIALVLVLMSFGATAQNVGINNTDPSLSLDITGGFGTRAVIGIPYLNTYNLPDNVSFVEIQTDGNVNDNVTIYPSPYVDGRRVVIKNICGFPATFGTSIINSLETKEFICRNPGGWSEITTGESSQVTHVTEGGKSGWRLLNEDPADHGNIGQKAMDLSVSTLGANSIYGATGDYAVALGRDVISEGESAIAIGKDVKANGLAATSLGSGNEVNGDYSTALGNDNVINTSNGAVAIGSINELNNANNSMALGSANIVNANAASAIGESNTVSGIAATAIGSNNNTEGDYAASIGFANAAVGNNSLAIGNSNAASNENAIAMGNESEALGVTTTAMGSSWASSLLSVSIGRYSDTIVGSNRSTWVDTDPLLAVGNGSSITNLKNAMTVYKNGTLQLENHTTTPANSTNKFYVQNNEPYFGTSGLKSQLEKITEGGNTGWRLAGSDPNYYGNIGQGAVDLSNVGCVICSDSYGASGSNSTALGYDNTASGSMSTATGYLTVASGNCSASFGRGVHSRPYLSLALGRYNDTIVGSNKTSWIDTEPLFMIGNGTSHSDRKNAMTVYKNGTLQLENHTTTPANSTDKFYVLNNEPYFGSSGLTSQLEKITEGGNTGWRLAGRNPDNYGDIGSGAVDFSINDYPSTEKGATGENSVAWGVGTKATHFASTAIGDNTTASAFAATAMGYNTTASGERSTAIGTNTTASAFAATGMGHNTIASGERSTAMGWGTTASGLSSIAMGWGTLSNNEASTAMGRETTASGLNSTAMGYVTAASGVNSTAMGQESSASGQNSLAMGQGSSASGQNSLAMGQGSSASGQSSLAANNSIASGLRSASFNQAQAHGENSFATGNGYVGSTGTNAAGIAGGGAFGINASALGEGTRAWSFSSTSLGRFNDGFQSTSSTNTWVNTDPLFIIGNGSSDTDRKNAMTVYKNANTEISGYTRLGLASEGAPIIKTKKIISTSHADHNGEKPISHGLTASKILAVSVLIEWNTNQFAPPAYSQSANLLYNYYINDGNIVIRNDTPSGNCLICNKPVKLFITYEE